MAADNSDIQLTIGLDDTLYRRQLEQLSEDTKIALSKIETEVGGSKYTMGSVKDNWAKFSNPVAHQKGIVDPESGDITRMGGNFEMSSSLMAGLNADMMGLGNAYKGTHAKKWKREQASLAASTWFMFEDPEEREAMLRAQGLGVAANMINSDVGKIIDTDYQMMQKDWAQRFVFDANDSGGKIKGAPDFQSMREYAAETGLGRWTGKEHNAANFELFPEQDEFNDELEKTEDEADKIKKQFKSWSDELKDALGTLGGILGTVGSIASVKAFDAKAASTISKETSSLDNERSFLGMDIPDVLSTRMASNRLGIGEDTIYSGIKNLGTMAGTFSMLGQGINILPAALLGSLDDIMNATDNPMERYKNIAQKVLDTYKANPEQGEKLLAMLEGQGVGGIGDIVGALGDFNRTVPGIYTVDDLFAATTSPYAVDAAKRSEEITTELADVNMRIKSAYLELYDDWMDSFGKPFRNWWATALEDFIVPIFSKAVETISAIVPEWIKNWKDDSAIEAKFGDKNYDYTEYFYGISTMSSQVKEILKANSRANKYIENYGYDYNTFTSGGKPMPAGTIIYNYDGVKTANGHDVVRNVKDAAKVDSYVIDALGVDANELNYGGLLDINDFTGTTKDVYNTLFNKKSNKVNQNISGKDFWKTISSLWSDKTLDKLSSSLDNDAAVKLNERSRWLKEYTEIFEFVPSFITNEDNPYSTRALQNTIGAYIGADTDAEAERYQQKLLALVAAIADKLNLDPDLFSMYLQQSPDGRYTMNNNNGIITFQDAGNINR